MVIVNLLGRSSIVIPSFYLEKMYVNFLPVCPCVRPPVMFLVIVSLKPLALATSTFEVHRSHDVEGTGQRFV